MDKETFKKTILDKLENEDISALESFAEFETLQMDLHDKIRRTHEFIDLLGFKLRQSVCNMDKDLMAEFFFELFKNTIDVYEYNKRFVSAQFKTLVIFYKNKKDYDKAIEVLEFLIKKGIADNDSQKFHIQLDDLFRLRKKKS